MRGEQAMPTLTQLLRRRRWSSVDDEQAESDGKNVPWNTTLGYTHSSFWDLKSLIFPKRDFGNTPSQDLQLKHLSRIDLSGCIKILPNAIFEMILKLKHLKYFEPPLLERRYAEHGFSWLLRTPQWKQCKKQERQLEGYTEIETMIEIRCAPGNPEEDEMKQGERMAIRVTNIANIVLFALKVFASIESKSLSIIASILDPFFDLLWGFILWLTSHAMQNPNPHKYPIGKKRMQPVGMIVFGSFGLQLLFQAAKQFITKAEPDKDPQKEKWMIGVMTFVTMVQFMLAFYCRRFENKIVRAYAEHHSSNVKTNLISLPAAVLAIRYYWWIDPTGAIIILLYTMNAWKKTFFESLFALTGRTAPPEFLEKLEVLIWNHHEDIKNIDTLIVYTFSSDLYFVEVEIVLPQDMVLSKAHDIGETLKEKLKQLPEVERAFVEMSCSFS